MNLSCLSARGNRATLVNSKSIENSSFFGMVEFGTISPEIIWVHYWLRGQTMRPTKKISIDRPNSNLNMLVIFWLFWKDLVPFVCASIHTHTTSQSWKWFINTNSKTASSFQKCFVLLPTLLVRHIRLDWSVLNFRRKMSNSCNSFSTCTRGKFCP